MSSRTESSRPSWWRDAAADRGGLRALVDGRALAAVLLVAIVAVGGWLRLSGADWDAGRHLHPDERYLTDVGAVIQWPGSIGQYLDVHDSPLSPYNTQQGRAYVYGQLPLFGGKLAGTMVGQDDYAHLNIAGRRLSALIDMGSIVLVFVLARMMCSGFGRRAAAAGALLAAALYAFTVTAIQFSHFFTTESWLVFFSLLTFLVAAYSLRSAIGEPTRRFRLIHVSIGCTLGLTVACKVSGAIVGVPVLIGLLGETALATRRVASFEAFLRFCASALTILVAGYVAFRAVSPYAFASSNWLDLRINTAFHDALVEQRNLMAGKGLYPPSYQWLLSSRLWDPLKNMVVWQLGIPLGVAALAGLTAMAVAVLKPATRLWRREKQAALEAERQAELTLLVMLLVFVLVVFGYFGTRFAHSGRYLVPLVPFATVAAAYGLLLLSRTPGLAIPVVAVVVAGTGAYALAYHHIYTRSTTRVAASDWIVQHVPAGSTIANEHWDDSLPVGGDAQRYKGVVLPVFDADDDTKLKKLYDGLSDADYYFLSSPRAWRTIGRLPTRFPIMPRFYHALFAGQLGFGRVASFSSEPELLGVTLHDVGAEEAFWVYDHAPVIIYKRSRPLSWPEFRGTLCSPAPAPPGCA
jgi:hypothetical protein